MNTVEDVQRAIEALARAASMHRDPRDTQFAGYAALLIDHLPWEDLLIEGEEEGWQDRWVTVAAQGLYDFACHVVTHMLLSAQGDMSSVPDRTEWPKEIESTPDLPEMSNIPDTTPQRAMSDARLREMVFLAIGRAGMCWSEIPVGTFDDVKAQQLGEELLKAIQDLQQGKG